jgi:hypothetical protein
MSHCLCLSWKFTHFSSHLHEYNFSNVGRCLLGCDAVRSGRNLHTFWRNFHNFLAAYASTYLPSNHSVTQLKNLTYLFIHSSIHPFIFRRNGSLKICSFLFHPFSSFFFFFSFCISLLSMFYKAKYITKTLLKAVLFFSEM